MAKRSFGNIRKLPSGRFQARYLGPDGLTHTAKTATGKPLTFATRGDADMWLALRHAEIVRGAWLPPAEPKPAVETLGGYAEDWLTSRDLAQTTKDHYRKLLDAHILPTFRATPLTSITPAAVRSWHANVARGNGKRGKDRPTTRAHAYALLRTICATAVVDEILTANPCRVRGAGQAKRAKRIEPATLPELEVIAAKMPERYRLLVLLAAWCALRFGELTELRRRDIDAGNGVVHIRRGVTRTSNGRVVKGPKSEAGKRAVNIPPHLLPLVTAHLGEHVARGRDALVFPADGGQHLAPSTLYRHFYPARAAAGREDLRFHDLRHTGAVLAAATGATLAELMARLGHSTAGAAMRYQHAAADRDKVIATALSDLAAVTTGLQAPHDP